MCGLEGAEGAVRVCAGALEAARAGEECGSNGLPLTPGAVTMLGRAQRLLALRHPRLARLLDVLRSRHERMIVVSEHAGRSLAETSRRLSYAEVAGVAYQVVDALAYLHGNNITHRTLAPDNILLDSHNNVKLLNYGLYYMTGCGKDVSFPLGLPKYLSPETILKGGGPMSDIWSLGIIVLELCLGALWPNLKPGPVLRRVLTLVHTSNPAERIAREHDSLEAYQNIPPYLREVIEKCLTIELGERASTSHLLDTLQEQAYKPALRAKSRGLMGCQLQYLYHWWQLAGGDVQAELKKQGLIKNTPPILTMPIAVLLDGCTLGGRKPALMDRRIAKYNLDLLSTRLSHIPLQFYYPLLNEPRQYCEAVALPRVIRERDTEYQFHRLILFERLLHGYPYTAPLIRQEAAIDIPPLVRGEVWAALLGVAGDVEQQYERIDKETPTSTDRQIEVDIPRCHQYCWLLSGAAGHNALKRLLKAWLLTNPEYVYWQGLDSLTAPFLYLNFNHEARAFACLSAFVPRFLHKFFLKDNSCVIKEYLAKFWQMTAFYEPRLASHLHEINFVPELFAIPWFLTMFSPGRVLPAAGSLVGYAPPLKISYLTSPQIRYVQGLNFLSNTFEDKEKQQHLSVFSIVLKRNVFPLHKIVQVWDALLAEGDALPLLMGVAILRQLRDTLLASGFNECILLFSDLPEIDIGECVKEALEMCRVAPRSISYRRHAKQPDTDDALDEVEIPMEVLLAEMSPRISCNDLKSQLERDACCVVDIRSHLLYEKWRIEGSINIPYSGVHLGERELSSPGAAHRPLLTAAKRNKTVVVVSGPDDTAHLFSEYLVRCGVARVCVLHGGVAALQQHLPAVLAPPGNTRHAHSDRHERAACPPAGPPAGRSARASVSSR